MIISVRLIDIVHDRYRPSHSQVNTFYAIAFNPAHHSDQASRNYFIIVSQLAQPLTSYSLQNSHKSKYLILQ